ncbi:hypothetical protein EON63_07395 [archaeon]|nr:MAG: hypothetical protein EON63_07395 [archaeon]
MESTISPIAKSISAITQPPSTVSVENFDKVCTDPQWCSVPMPSKSHFYFDSPSDLNLWKKSQILAMRGDQVLLKDAIKAFPNHMDFLDGDISFRKMHYAMDVFIDERRDLSPLLPVMQEDRVRKVTDDQSRRLAAAAKYPWEAEGKRVIPDPYNFRQANRAPVISVGYTAYQRDSQTYFSGNRLGGAFLDRNRFFGYWRKVKSRIDFPFIATCTLNENWGFLSTYFPNRTAAWGKCCNNPRDAIVYEFLNHEKTLLLVTNQHVNITHPKLLIWPRGIPITWGTTSKLIWDTMRNVYQSSLVDVAGHNKNLLLLAASSSWGPRPQILQCVSNHFAVEQFEGHVLGMKGKVLYGYVA